MHLYDSSIYVYIKYNTNVIYINKHYNKSNNNKIKRNKYIPKREN